MSNRLVDRLEAVDKFNFFLGSLAKWIVAALVLLGFFEVAARYFFDSPTVWGYEMLCMLGATTAALAWGYVEATGGHVRVDVLYDLFPRKVQLLIDVIGGLVFGIPVFVVYIVLSFRWAIDAWVSKEVLMESFWYPSAVPIRIVVLIGFLNGFFMFLVNFIRRVFTLVSGEEFKGLEKGEDL